MTPVAVNMALKFARSKLDPNACCSVCKYYIHEIASVHYAYNENLSSNDGLLLFFTTIDTKLLRDDSSVTGMSATW